MGERERDVGERKREREGLLGRSEDLQRSRSQASFFPLWEWLDQLNLSFPIFRFVLYHASDNLIGYGTTLARKPKQLASTSLLKTKDRM